MRSMFCRRCGAQIDDRGAVCVKCGAEVGDGWAFCPNCGGKTDPRIGYCMRCGVSLAQFAPMSQRKSKVAAGLFGIFLGCFGIHNFYLGYIGKGIAQLLITFLSCGLLSWVTLIWSLIEGILILCGSISTDKQGIPLK